MSADSKMGLITVVFFACGHQNIQGTHKTTIEFTKEKNLSRQGDCILGINSTKGAIDLPSEFKEALRKVGAKIKITIEVGTLEEIINAKGNPDLQFTHPTDLVIRKSNYLCNRTLAIEADKAAINISRKLIEKLKNPKQRIKITLEIKDH
ncbi:MAG: DUF371 domain-containing protein [Candidatus Bathyarchaeota archaeon]